jgi:hypothetical protein
MTVALRVANPIVQVLLKSAYPVVDPMHDGSGRSCICARATRSAVGCLILNRQVSNERAAMCSRCSSEASVGEAVRNGDTGVAARDGAAAQSSRQGRQVPKRRNALASPHSPAPDPEDKARCQSDSATDTRPLSRSGNSQDSFKHPAYTILVLFGRRKD